MAQFSENDINEAKRRVMDMRSKASLYTSQSQEKEARQEEHCTEEEKPEKDAGDDKSLFLILALIMILSHEEADSKLILALLYLLL